MVASTNGRSVKSGTVSPDTNTKISSTPPTSGRRIVRKSPPENGVRAINSNGEIIGSEDTFNVEHSSQSENPSVGLSELSKQLRVLQAKNQSQASIIDKLERQLKIMSDLKGVSVADLKGALVDACQSEAYAELLSQVSSLQAQLVHAKESLTVSGSTQVEFDNEASSHKVAALELRVGELEEVDEGLREEMNRLYQQVEHQSSRATRLEASTNEQRLQIEKLNHSLHEASIREKDHLEREEIIKLELKQAAQVVTKCQFDLNLQHEKATRLENEVDLREKEKIQRVKEVRKTMNAEMVKIQMLLSEQTQRSNELMQLNQSQKVEIDALRTRSVKTVRNTEVDQEVNTKVMQADMAELRRKVQDVDKMVELERQKCQREIKRKEETTMAHLDEVETRLRNETQTLFRLWDTQAALAKQLEVACNQEKATVANLQRQLVACKEADERRNGEIQDLQNEHELLRSKVRESELQAQVERERAKNLTDQLEAKEGDVKLRKKQFKSRFQVQTDRIGDLEQQLSSLYSAFGIFQSERSEEQATNRALQIDLNDTAIAQEIYFELQEKTSEQELAVERDKVDAKIARELHFDELHRQQVATTLSPTARNGPSPVIVAIHGGWLQKKDRLKGWKRRYFLFRGNFEEGVFSLRYADNPGAQVKGEIHVQRRSVVSRTNEFSKQRFAFTIQSDPVNSKGAVTHLAAESAEDLNKWMSALLLMNSSKRSPAFPVDSVVLIDGPHEAYNGLTGVVKSPMKEDGRQKVWVETLDRLISVPPDHMKPDQVARLDQASQSPSSHPMSEQTRAEAAAERQQRLFDASSTSPHALSTP